MVKCFEVAKKSEFLHHFLEKSYNSAEFKTPEPVEPREPRELLALEDR